ncbi:MAG: glycerol-3-phosphate dehydrogenase [Stellaceae bacterium]
MFDLLVVGGGINGVGIARDAAGRGLSVRLVEKDDLAAATSSASSKLIHGGLRYPEHGALRLVREALAEREILLANAPHIVRPLRFVLPHDRGPRSRVVLRLGLFLYDHLGGRRSLPGTETVRLRDHPYGTPLRHGLDTGFVYSDCSVEDARLVVLNARDAKAHGAQISPRTELRRAWRAGGHWRAVVEKGGAASEIAARILVNAAGPWVEEVMCRAGVARHRSQLRLVKGSHIVVPRLYDGAQGYLLQHDDGRVVFVLPYEHKFTLIGTTELPYSGDCGQVTIDREEVDYLCRAVSRWFARSVAPSEVVRSYAGVRPLHDDGERDPSAVTRDYLLDLDAAPGMAPLLSVFGGKITTFRRLAERALEKLAPFLPTAGRPWTGGAVLPGGDLPNRDPVAFAASLVQEYPFLEPVAALRLAFSYGGDTRRILGRARRAEDLGRGFGFGFNECELAWLVGEEWALTLEDVMWRRSKLGLHLGREAMIAIASLLPRVASV